VAGISVKITRRQGCREGICVAALPEILWPAQRLDRFGHTGQQAALWRAGFGAQAIPMGVIAGVFKLKNLEDAQTKGIAIVWERDLAPLAEFVRAAR
jgi:hypothetical protein